MRYSGKIGVASQTEKAPGIWEDTITERDALGEVKQRTEVLGTDDSVLAQYRTTTSISVFCEGVTKENYKDLRYITYLGQRWTIASAVFDFPRHVLYIGEVYNGPVPG